MTLWLLLIVDYDFKLIAHNYCLISHVHLDPYPFLIELSFFQVLRKLRVIFLCFFDKVEFLEKSQSDNMYVNEIMRVSYVMMQLKWGFLHR